jgi:Rad3-related DNA helicase
MSEINKDSLTIEQLRSRHDQWEAIAHQLADTLIAHPNNLAKHQEILNVYENIKNQNGSSEWLIAEKDRWHDLVHQVWMAFEPLNLERMAELMRIYEENMH